MRKLIPWSLAALFTLTVAAVADLSVKDGGGTTRTIFNFTCFTTKLCNSTVLIDNAGTEVGTAAAPLRINPTGTTAQPVSAASGVAVDGWDATQGAKADSVCGTATGTCSVTALLKYLNTAAVSASTVRAQSSEQTAVATGAVANMAADLTGKMINLPYANPENFLTGQVTAAMTATTSTALTGMGAQGAGVRNYVTACTFSNTHATVGTMINLQDGSGGSVLWQAPAAPAYGGAQVQFPTPIKTTANTGLFAVNVTTGSSTLVSCTGYKGI